MSGPDEGSGPEDVVGEEEDPRVSAKKEKAASSGHFDILTGKGKDKDKKEKKEKKEKETRYAHLGDDSSGNEDVPDGRSPAKTKKSKPFMFGSAKKDKDKKSKDKDKEKPKDAAAPGDLKKKPKLKLIKSSKSHQGDHHVSEQKTKEEAPVFGVPLELATKRFPSHDGIPLPVLVRQCVDFIEDQGLMQEGIYRSSGQKSKITKLRSAFNAKQHVDLYEFEPAVVASVLKLFLRELPEPVLTVSLMPRFEKVAEEPVVQKRIEGIKALINELPDCNKYLVQWIFTHMMHVIEREKFNKMNLQNVSIVLSPTMKISHRVLNCLFENRHSLFDGVQLKKYVPPITSESGVANLPNVPEAIEEEIRKQESLLTELHSQISTGAASKKTEEQIWEQQRIVTQLKRKLRTAKSQQDQEAAKPKYEPIDYDEELNFSLQTPAHLPKTTDQVEETQQEADSEPADCQEKALDVSSEESPEATEETEQKVTVMVHRSQENDKKEEEEEVEEEVKEKDHVTVIKVCSNEIQEKTVEEVKSEKTVQIVTEPKEMTTVDSGKKGGNFPLLPPPPQPTKIRAGHTHILRPTPASPAPKKIGESNEQAPLSLVPSSFTADRNVDFSKSKSLPRGLPSDGSVFGAYSDVPKAPSGSSDLSPEKLKEMQELAEKEALLDELELEEYRAKFEYEELMALKSELERRKRSERKEMEDLREELASMQTLYQYRTCSVDSSEDSSDEVSDKESNKDEVGQLNKVLDNLIRENLELEQTRQSLCQKIQEERAACVNLRVEIRVEQERKRMQKRRNAQQAI